MEKEIIIAILTDKDEARSLKSATYLNIMPADLREKIVKAIEQYEK